MFVVVSKPLAVICILPDVKQHIKPLKWTKTLSTDDNAETTNIIQMMYAPPRLSLWMETLGEEIHQVYYETRIAYAEGW